MHLNTQLSKFSRAGPPISLGQEWVTHCGIFLHMAAHHCDLVVLRIFFDFLLHLYFNLKTLGLRASIPSLTPPPPASMNFCFRTNLRGAKMWKAHCMGMLAVQANLLMEWQMEKLPRIHTTCSKIAYRLIIGKYQKVS